MHTRFRILRRVRARHIEVRARSPPQEKRLGNVIAGWGSDRQTNRSELDASTRSARTGSLKQRIIAGRGVKIQRPLIHFQIHHHRIIRADADVSSRRFNLNIIGGDVQIVFLRFRQDRLANFFISRAIHAGRAGNILNAVLKLIFVYQKGRHLYTHEYNQCQEALSI